MIHITELKLVYRILMARLLIIIWKSMVWILEDIYQIFSCITA